MAGESDGHRSGALGEEKGVGAKNGYCVDVLGLGWSWFLLVAESPQHWLKQELVGAHACISPERWGRTVVLLCLGPFRSSEGGAHLGQEAANKNSTTPPRPQEKRGAEPKGTTGAFFGKSLGTCGVLGSLFILYIDIFIYLLSCKLIAATLPSADATPGLKMIIYLFIYVFIYLFIYLNLLLEPHWATIGWGALGRCQGRLRALLGPCWGSLTSTGGHIEASRAHETKRKSVKL